MAKIIVGFSKPKTWKLFAWLIMTGYGIPYDHVYMKFSASAYQRDIIYQASKLMVNFMGTAIFYSDNVTVNEFEIDISPEKYIKLMQFAIDNAGKPYGVMSAFGLGIARLCALIGIKIHNPFGDGSNTWVCDEIAGEILEEFDDAKLSVSLDDLTPKDLYIYLASKKP